MDQNNSAGAGVDRWNATGRTLVFLLSATSIACLLFELYGWCPMRRAALLLFMPAMVLLLGYSTFDKRRGGGRLWRAIMIGIVGGLLAAVAYDVFRLPFVYAREWGLGSLIAPMQLFKVFPRFGAMLLGEPLEQATYSMAAQLTGWLYHFSNGATFGVMYVALIGDGARRHWSWAVLMAVVLELGMLLTPYPQVFGIPLTPRFVAITAAAHGIFGVALGQVVRRLARGARQTATRPS
jgi:hypothetical protein